MTIAGVAGECGVKHLVYSSGGAVGDKPTGLGHFDSKARIEAHIRTLPITAPVVRPVAFMEMLVMPGFGLNEGRFTFLAKPDRIRPAAVPPEIMALDKISKRVNRTGVGDDDPTIVEPVASGLMTPRIFTIAMSDSADDLAVIAAR